jgi:CheY-like chemotaxis protein
VIINPILKRAVRIIIVDDEKMLATTIVKGLHGNGYESIMLVDTARSCLEQLETKPCDIALIAISMPAIDGLQLADVLREYYPDMPLIALIGNPDPDISFNAKSAGFNDLIKTPFSVEDVLKALESQILHLDSPSGVFATTPKSDETILIWG